MDSINGIMRDVAQRAGELWQSEKGLTFLFGDWPYIADTLTVWGQNPETAAQKFPCLALYSPFTEQRGGERQAVGTRTAYLQMLLMVNTRPEYDNETRERVSFEAILRPLYDCLMEAIRKERRIVTPYKGTIAHDYRENYRYGRSGVNGSDGKTFFDYIDAIELNKMQVVFRDTCD